MTSSAGTPAIAHSRLIVLAGPTAVGKGTVAAEVRRHHPEVWISVSATTRKPRPGEENGVHYWFVSDEDFDAMAERGDLLEWAVVHGINRYGTPRGPVDLALASGHPAMLEIDLQGARQVRDDHAGGAVRLPQAAVLGRARTPTGRSRHRGCGRTGAPSGHRARANWPPRASST